MKNLFHNALLEHHKELVRKDNCSIEQVFEMMLFFCSGALLLVSFFFEEYSSMRIAYGAYLVISAVLFIISRYYISHHLAYAQFMMIVVLIESYSYAIFSGIIYNRHAPSITVYALIVASCSAFFVPISFTIVFHSIAALFYCGLAIWLKPEYGAQDTLNYIFFLIMSFALTSIVYKTRLAYLQTIDDTLAQKNVAEENVKLERKLRASEQASQAKSKFLSRMSHEIRTPINAILGISELEKQDVRSDDINRERFMEYTKETAQAAKYLLSLVNDILESSKIEQNEMEIQKYPINVENHWSSIKTIATPMAESRNIHFTMERATDFDDTYICDGVRMQQIVLNLLSNAFKFTPPGGSVKLTVDALKKTETTTTLRFTVIDNGIGMSEEFQSKLFQQFAQEEDSNTSKFEGSGLGLYISQKLANLMEGKITCQSAEGKGSTFTAIITVGNVTEADKETIPETKPEDTDTMDFEGIHILLCEDHPLNQRITKAMLERKNCTVDIAEDGVIGVDMFEKSELGYYALILMDIRMPNMDGLDATRTIRELDRADSGTVPIIAMSANTYPEDIQKSLTAGMNEHLAKPVEADKLIHTIGRYTNYKDDFSVEEKQKILLVDDIEMNRMMLRRVLIDEYDVLLAENGKEALQILEKYSDIIAVVTDIQMPEMDGIELVRQIRREIKYDNVAILANTQFGDEKQEHLLAGIGADDFVYKPITPTLLSVRLRNVLARRKQIL